MKTYGGFYVSRVHQLSGRVFERILKESGIDTFNGAQGRIIYVLWEHEKLPISEVQATYVRKLDLLPFHVTGYII